MLRISRWVFLAVLVLETALVGTVARAQSPGRLDKQWMAWAPIVETVAVYNWTGFYIGGNIGGAWGHRNIDMQKTFAGDPFFDGTFGTRNVQGAFGGAQAGYNWQRDHWVFGVVLDAQGGSIDGKSRETVEPFLSAGNSIKFHTSECVDFFSTLRGRVGYTWDRVQIYGTAGAAVANTNIRIGMTNTFGFDAAARDRAVRGGWVAGAGGEYALNPKWSIVAEYLYMDFGDASTGAREFLGAVPSAFNVSNTTRINYQTVRFGLNYKLTAGLQGIFSGE